jgi:hypothetical protein
MQSGLNVDGEIIVKMLPPLQVEGFFPDHNIRLRHFVGDVPLTAGDQVPRFGYAYD